MFPLTPFFIAFFQGLTPEEKRFILLVERGDCASVAKTISQMRSQPKEVRSLACDGVTPISYIFFIYQSYSLFIYQDENEDENQSFCCSCMFWNKHVTNDPIIMKSNTQGLICLSQAWSRTNQNFRKNQKFCFHLCLGTWTGYLSSTVLPAMRNLCDSKVNVNVELPEKLEVGETHS